jgi:hypothetical protein
MIVVAPYTTFAPGVTEALDGTGWPWQAAYVGGSDDAYWQLLSDRWSDGESFTIVEHDVIVRTDTLTELSYCPSAWCSFAIPYLYGEYAGMACVKFSAELIASCPDALGIVGLMSTAQHPRKHWCTLDSFLQATLQRTGTTRHLHEPALGHFRADGLPPMPTHGCHRREEYAP